MTVVEFYLKPGEIQRIFIVLMNIPYPHRGLYQVDIFSVLHILPSFVYFYYTIAQNIKKRT